MGMEIDMFEKEFNNEEELCLHYGIPYSLYMARKLKGWDIRKILKTKSCSYTADTFEKKVAADYRRSVLYKNKEQMLVDYLSEQILVKELLITLSKSEKSLIQHEIGFLRQEKAKHERNIYSIEKNSSMFEILDLYYIGRLDMIRHKFGSDAVDRARVIFNDGIYKYIYSEEFC